MRDEVVVHVNHAEPTCTLDPAILDFLQGACIYTIELRRRHISNVFQLHFHVAL